MSSIKRQPSGRWQARYRDDTGREHAQRFDRKVDAERWLHAERSRIDRGDRTDPRLGKVTVGEWSAAWLSGQHQLTPSTRGRYATSLKVQVLPTWRDVPLSAVQHSAVTAWVGVLVGSGLSASTVRHAFRVLSLVLDSAVRDGRLARNPAPGVRLPRAAKPDKRFLTADQVAMLAQEAGPGQYDLVVRVLAYTGLRFGELTALRTRRVDLMRRRLEVAEAVTEVSGQLEWGETKNHQRRSVPIPRSMVDELAQLLAGRDPDDLVFTAPDGGVLRLHNLRRRVFAPAAARAGLAGLTPHELRHTAASLAVAAGPGSPLPGALHQP
jgi:integrase